MRDRDMDRNKILLGESILLAVAIGLTIGGSIKLKNAKASASWPQVKGTVLTSEVETSTITNRSDHTSFLWYAADVAYEYSVDGTTYACHTVSFGQGGSRNPEHARQIVNRYPEGKQVQVYYDPARPEVAVLEPGVSWSSYTLLGMGLVFAVLALLLLLNTLVAKEEY